MVLSSALFDRMISHCRSAYPNEACGILTGKGGTAEKLYEMTNVESSPVSYFMDPEEQFRAIKEMRKDGHVMLAIYHSHPHAPAYPSGKDIRLASYPDSLYIILGLASADRPEVRAYEIVDGEVKEAKLTVQS